MNKNTTQDVSSFIAILVIVGFVILLISAIAYSFDIPEKLFKVIDETGKVQPNNVNGEFFKFLLLVVGGIIAIYGLLVNYKRLEITNKQVEQQTEQVKIAIKQIQLAEKTQINTRFKDAAQLLASEHTSAILSGIYALDQIAVEVSKSDDEQYKGYVQVVLDILCAYLRENSSRDDENKPIGRSRGADIVFQTIVSQLFVNNKEVYSGLVADLRTTYLAGLNLRKANLQGAWLHHANLQRASLDGAKLQGARLDNTKLQNTYLDYVNFQGARLWDTNFENAWLVDTNFESALLEDTNFQGARLWNTNFQGAKFFATDFSNAKIKGNTNFTGTKLADYSIEEIRKPGRSIELTSDPED